MAKKLSILEREVGILCDYVYVDRNGGEEKITETLEKEYGFKNVKHINDDNTDTHCIVADKGNKRYFIFEGTESFEDAIQDAQAIPYGTALGRCHSGVVENIQCIMPKLDPYVAEAIKERMVIVAGGHSLGASNAERFAFEVNRPEIIICRATAPFPIGDEKWNAEYLRRVPNTIVFTHNNDIVPRCTDKRHFKLVKKVLREKLGIEAPYLKLDEKEVYFNRYGKIRKYKKIGRMYDRIAGYIIGIGDGRLDGFRDHDMPLYRRFIEENS